MSVALTLDRERNMLTTDRWGDVPYPRPYVNSANPGVLLNVGPVIVVSQAVVAACVALGPLNPFGTTETSIDIDDDGDIHMTVTADNGRWCWQLYEAHWTEGDGPPVFVGIWRD